MLYAMVNLSLETKDLLTLNVSEITLTIEQFRRKDGKFEALHPAI